MDVRGAEDLLAWCDMPAMGGRELGRGTLVNNARRANRQE